MSEQVITGNDFEPLWKGNFDSVVLEECDLTDLRPIGSVPGVRELTLEYCRVNPSSLRAWLSAFPDLRDLYLTGLPLGKLHWAELPDQLEALYVMGGRLKELGGAPASLPLKVLQVTSCQLRYLDLPPSMPGLQRLDLAHNPDLESCPPLPRVAGEFRLNLVGCGLVRFPEDPNADRVAELNLSGNLLRIIPESIAGWRALRVLIANKAGLVRVHPALGQCGGIKTVHLKDNPLGHWPHGLTALTQLESLDLTRSQVMEVPSSIGKLRRLSSLKLAENPITQLSEAINKLERLESLNLWKSSLFYLPLNLNGLKSLRQLDISYNPMEKLPDVSGLKSLRFLGMAGLRRLDWPAAFEQLNRLPGVNQITLSNSNFEDFDFRILDLPGLKRLDVNGTLPHPEVWQQAREQKPGLVIWGA